MHEALSQVPDNLKVGVSVAPAALALLGIGLQDWVYITSAIVSLTFVIEKMPIVIRRIKEFSSWVTSLFGK